MPYQLHIESGADSDDLRSLASFLASETELHGCVDLADHPPEPGHLGAVADAIVIAVGSGGALTVLAGAVVTWVQSRGGTIRVRLQSPTGATAEIEAEHVKSLDAAGIRALVADVNTALRGPSSPPE